MNLEATLSELIREWRRINRAIARLEARQRNVEQRIKLTPGGRRGRKTMGPEERLEVSRRMTEYWRARRRAQEREKTPSD